MGLALELVGFGFGDPLGRTRFAPTSSLISQGLVEVEEATRAVLTRPLRVPDRVIDHLLGVDHEDQQLRTLTIPSVTLKGPDVERFSMVFQNGARFVYFQDGPSGIGAAIGASALAAAGFEPLTIDLTRLNRREDADLVIRAAIREARIRHLRPGRPDPRFDHRCSPRSDVYPRRRSLADGGGRPGTVEPGLVPRGGSR